MSKEKNKNTFRIGALLLVACLISSVMLSGTFAKYTSEYAGKDTALVARWSFTGNFDDVALSGTNIDLPIWDHAYVTNIYEKHGDSYLIAPGIQGSFVVDFSYDADVDADLTFELTKTGDAATKVPIQYSIDNFTTIFYSLDDIEDEILNPQIDAGKITGMNGAYKILDTAASGSGTATDEAVGTGDGTTLIFNLNQTPTTGTLTVKDNAVLVVADNYTVVGNRITFDSAPETGHAITASYTYDKTAVNVSATVSWRWPYDVNDHNGAAAVTARGNAVTAGELLSAGTGADGTWIDSDDTALGEASGNNAPLGRDDYKLTLTIKAEQLEPATL